MADHPLCSIPVPPSKRILQLETGSYERILKEQERKGLKISDLEQLRLELYSRKDQYRIGTGDAYEHPFDVTRIEKQNLIGIFRGLRGSSWNHNEGWIGQDKTMTKQEIKVFEAEASLYHGIEIATLGALSDISSAVVSSIVLPGNGCEGEFPPQICELEYLKELNLQLNLIEGNLPRLLSNIERIESINIAGNFLTGAIDSKIFMKFLHLKALDLSFNKFEGPMPDIFNVVSSLTELNLSGNSLSGPLPSSISKLTKLKSLKLFANQLEGSIPKSFSLLQNLVHLNLSQNHFTSGIESIFECTKLRVLVLNDNRMNDTLSENLCKLHLVENMLLQKNKFEGIFLPAWCQMSNLKRLNLSFNEMSGVLPPDLGRMTQLQCLVLSGNKFVGPLPRSMSCLTKLRDFHVFKDYESDSMKMPRGFNRQKFERITVWGPSVGLNNVCWEEEQHDAAANDTKEPNEEGYK